MTPEERDRIIRSIISSQALSGLNVSYEEAEQALDQAIAEPGLPTGVRPEVIESGRRIIAEDRELLDRLAAYDAEPCCPGGRDTGDCTCSTDRSRS